MFSRILLVITTLFTASLQRDYSYFKVYRVALRSSTDLERILSLEDGQYLELLSPGHAGYIDILVKPEHVSLCRSQLGEMTLLTQDVGKLVTETLLSAGQGNAPFSYTHYHTLDVIYEHLATMATLHSDIATVLEIGKSYEGRSIKAMRISKDIARSENKPMIWIDGGIHAREWIAVSTVTYILDALLGEVEEDAQEAMSAILEKFQVVIVPCVNVDGYVHTQVDRLWRKNRAPAGCRGGVRNWFGGCFSEQCFGIDLNRNWGPARVWNTTGVSTNPCSDVYPGSAPFDQPSTEAVREYLMENASLLVLFLSYHSYSQLFLTPIGYSTDFVAPHVDHYEKVGRIVVDAIGQRHGTEYKAMSMAQLYAASGNSPDWVYMTLGLVDTYIIELRDSGGYGFELPETEIIPTGQENLDGFLALVPNIIYQ